MKSLLLALAGVALLPSVSSAPTDALNMHKRTAEAAPNWYYDEDETKKRDVRFEVLPRGKKRSPNWYYDSDEDKKKREATPNWYYDSDTDKKKREATPNWYYDSDTDKKKK